MSQDIIKDAARYQWLREQTEGDNEAFADVYIRYPEEAWAETQIKRGAQLDAAIDAVMGKQ